MRSLKPLLNELDILFRNNKNNWVRYNNKVIQEVTYKRKEKKNENRIKEIGTYLLKEHKIKMILDFGVGLYPTLEIHGYTFYDVKSLLHFIDNDKIALEKLGVL